MANSADPDQFASEEANWSGSTLFAKTGQGLIYTLNRNWKKNQFSDSTGRLSLSVDSENGPERRQTVSFNH